jgi:tetratricopeptide (TPR) repeat protein
MSRFRQREAEPVREVPPPLPGAGNVKPLPMAESEFARRRRKPILIWTSVAGGLLAALAIGVYIAAKPASALNSLSDARRFYEKGDYNEALARLELPLHERATRAQAYSLRAEIYRSLAQPAKAIGDLTRVIALQPGVPDHYRLRAQLYLQTGSPERAAADYSTLIKLEGSADSYLGRGLCYAKMGNAKRAIDDFTQSIAIKPGVGNYFQRGLAYESWGEHRQAIDDYDRALAINAGAAQVYRARAYSLDAIGERAKAATDRTTATKLETAPPPSP